MKNRLKKFERVNVRRYVIMTLKHPTQVTLLLKTNHTKTDEVINHDIWNMTSTNTPAINIPPSRAVMQ